MKTSSLMLTGIVLVGCGLQGRGAGGPGPSAVRVLATVAKEPLYLAVDDSFLYWTASGGELFRLPKSGGTPILLASVDRGIDAEFRQLVADGTDVYVIEAGERDDGDRILAVPKQGGAARVIAKLRRLPSSITVDEKYVYWVDDGPRDEVNNGGLQVLKAPKSGGASVIVAKADHAASEVTDIVVDDESVYWVEAIGVFRSPKRGGRPELLWHGEEDVEGQPQAYGGALLVAAGGHLYVASVVATIERVPKSGGPAVRVVDRVWDDHQAPGAQPSVVGLAVDGSSIYWTNDPSSGNGSLHRASHDGGSVAQLASRIDHPGPVVVDRTHVYWIDVGRRSIVSIRK